MFFLVNFLTIVFAEVPHSEIQDLHDLYEQTQGDNWNWRLPTPQWNFSTSSDGSYLHNPCADGGAVWQGLTCTGVPSTCILSSATCHVTSIELRNYNLQGSLPSTMTNLYLEVLILSNNSIGGVIPPELGRLTSMTLLEINRNEIVGAVPNDISGLGNIIM